MFIVALLIVIVLVVFAFSHSKEDIPVDPAMWDKDIETKYDAVKDTISKTERKEILKAKANHQADLYERGEISKSDMTRQAKDLAGIEDTTFSAAQKAFIYDRDAGLCQICGVRTELLRFPLDEAGRLYNKKGGLNPRAYEADHIIPRRDGGRTIVSNGQCTCHRCNNAKPKA